MTEKLHIRMQACKLCLIASIFLSIALFSSCGPSEQDMQRVKKDAMSELHKHASIIQEEMTSAMISVRKLAQLIEKMQRGGELSEQRINLILKEALENHPTFLAVWTCFEQGILDDFNKQGQKAEGYDASGRFAPYWSRINGHIQLSLLSNYLKAGTGDYYLIPLSTGTETVIDPIAAKFDGKKIYKTIMAVPVHFGDKIVGVAGIDIPLRGFFEHLVKKINFFGIGYCFVLSNNGTMVAHPTRWSNVGKTLDIFSFQKDTINAVKEGREAIEDKTSKTTGNKTTYMFVPIKIGTSAPAWSLAGNLPLNYLREIARRR